MVCHIYVFFDCIYNCLYIVLITGYPSVSNATIVCPWRVLSLVHSMSVSSHSSIFIYFFLKIPNTLNFNDDLEFQITTSMALVLTFWNLRNYSSLTRFAFKRLFSESMTHIGVFIFIWAKRFEPISYKNWDSE